MLCWGIGNIISGVFSFFWTSFSSSHRACVVYMGCRMCECVDAYLVVLRVEKHIVLTLNKCWGSFQYFNIAAYTDPRLSIYASITTTNTFISSIVHMHIYLFACSSHRCLDKQLERLCDCDRYWIIHYFYNGNTHQFYRKILCSYFMRSRPDRISNFIS